MQGMINRIATAGNRNIKTPTTNFLHLRRD